MRVRTKFVICPSNYQYSEFYQRLFGSVHSQTLLQFFIEKQIKVGNIYYFGLHGVLLSTIRSVLRRPCGPTICPIR